MIPVIYIQQWRQHAPWISDAMVEQDLIICRALVDIFNDEFLSTQLAFRGGTALHKLFLSPQPRYSEDIDLVQITPGPIKPIMYRIGEVLNWLPNRSTAQKRHSNKLYFRFESEIPPIERIRLKIEINCVEHFSNLGFIKIPFSIQNGWFSGKTDITTYQLEELLGTKLRALYQRKKGRDLFDLYRGLTICNPDISKIIDSYIAYMKFSAGSVPSYKEYKLNIDGKMVDDEFLTDVQPLLRNSIVYNPIEAYREISNALINLMDGNRE